MLSQELFKVSIKLMDKMYSVISIANTINHTKTFITNKVYTKILCFVIRTLHVCRVEEVDCYYGINYDPSQKATVNAYPEFLEYISPSACDLQTRNRHSAVQAFSNTLTSAGALCLSHDLNVPVEMGVFAARSSGS